MTSSRMIKTAVLAWLRFGKQFPYIATECGAYSADVLGTDGKIVIEVEVKVSRADLRNDFRSKDKHRKYKLPSDGYYNEWIPHQFYFAVPEHLGDYAIELTEKDYPDYGVIVCRDEGFSLADCAVTKRRAKKLHENPVLPRIQRAIALRMGSELCSIYLDRCGEDSMLDRATKFAKNIEKIADIDPELPQTPNILDILPKIP